MQRTPLSRNQVHLIGRIGGEIDFRLSQKENRWARFSLATSNWSRNASGEAVERTDWHDIVVLKSELLEALEQAAAGKGATINLVGELRYRAYEDEDGNKRRVTEILVAANGLLSVLYNSNKTDMPS